MTMKLTLAAMAAMAMAGVAQAAMDNVATGNSSVVFVAIDQNSNTGLVVDLGLRMADFASVADSALPQGSWNFANDSTTFAGVTGNAWSAAYSTFKSTQSGGDFRWGVVAGDQVSSNTPVIARGVLATGNPTQAQITSTTSAQATVNAYGNLGSFIAVANNQGTHPTAGNGAAATTSTSGTAWLPTLMADRFGGQLTWSYLLANNTVSNFQFQINQSSNPAVRQFGIPTTIDSLTSAPLTFHFDIATDTLTVAAVPEPGTYAMLLAGLAALGFVARRRKA